MRKTIFRAIPFLLMIALLTGISMPIVSAALRWNAPTSVPFTDVSNHWERDWNAPTSVLFTDVSNHWAYSNGYIGWAYANGITTGFPDNTFRPNANVTRAEFVTFLYRIRGELYSNLINPFTDVRQGAWYENAAIWAHINAITTGTTFHPNRPITREEIATMLRRYVRTVDMQFLVSSANALDDFPDRNSVSSWATEGVQWAVYHGIIGRGGSLDPQGNATRGETVAMLNRVVNTFDIRPAIPGTIIVTIGRGCWNCRRIVGQDGVTWYSICPDCGVDTGFR